MCEEIDAADVFKIAEKVERDAAAFYRKAAQLFDESDVKTTFIQLADWELEHEKRFARMRKQLGQQASEIKSQDSSEYKALAGLNVFAMQSDPAGRLHAGLTREQVIKKAMQKERHTIIYYEGLKDFALDPAVKSNIDEIIKQEYRHIDILDRVLRGNN
jgi:rubrerythrin